MSCNKNNIKVLQVTSVPASFEKLLLPLIEALGNEGFKVDLCCGPGEYFDSLVARGHKVIQMPFSRKVFSLNHLLAFVKLYRFLRQERYQIVHFHTAIVSSFGRIAARLARVPVIIYTAHGFYSHDRMNPFIYKIFFWIEKMLARRATDWLFLVSEEDEALARRNGFMSSAEKIVWIGNGVDPKRFEVNEDRDDIREGIGISKDDIAIGFVGRVVREKGILELINALATIRRAHNNVKLVIIGGTLESDRDKRAVEEIKMLIKKHALEKSIIALGFRDDIPQLLTAIDIFALPSYREGLPISIMEAMMSGKPVVATNIRGCREEVVHGETGFIVEPKDVRGLAEALEALISNPELAKMMGEKGRERALSLYDEKLTIGKQSAAYRKIAKSLAIVR